MTGISISEFARRAGLSRTAIQKAIKAGKLSPLSDGSLDPGVVEGPWRKANRRAAGAPRNPATDAVQPGETVEQAAERIVVDEGHAPHSLAEAERIKENFAAKLKELEYAEKSGRVVKVADARRVLAAQCAVIRNRILSLPAEVAPRCANMSDPAQIEAFIQAEIKQALEALAIDLAASADDLRRALH